MRKLLIGGMAAALAIAAGIGVAVAHHPVPTHPRAAVPAVAASTPATDVPSPNATPTASSSTSAASTTITRLTAPGTFMYVNLPAAVSIPDANGTPVTAELTVHELTVVSARASAGLLVGLSALDGYTGVYEVPVTLTVIKSASSTTTWTPQALGSLTAAVNPGATPPLSINTLTTPRCPGLPQSVQLDAGQSLQWCIHAFTKPGYPTPTGGQYQAATGPYATPIQWASRAISRPTIP